MTASTSADTLHGAKSVLKYLLTVHGWKMSRMQLWRLSRLADDPLPARLSLAGRRSLVTARANRLDAWVRRHTSYNAVLDLAAKRMATRASKRPAASV